MKSHSIFKIRCLIDPMRSENKYNAHYIDTTNTYPTQHEPFTR